MGAAAVSNLTIYVQPQNQAVFDAARTFSAGCRVSLSQLIADALAAYIAVESPESLEDRLARIELLLEKHGIGAEQAA